MRSFCKKASLFLCDTGLHLCAVNESGAKVIGRSVRARTEEDIFHALGLEYVRPEHRDLGEGKEKIKFIDRTWDVFEGDGAEQGYQRGDVDDSSIHAEDDDDDGDEDIEADSENT